jgi:hypothetical protein
VSFEDDVDVATPFTVALNGDVTILPLATTDELIMEVGIVMLGSTHAG